VQKNHVFFKNTLEKQQLSPGWLTVWKEVGLQEHPSICPWFLFQMLKKAAGYLTSVGFLSKILTWFIFWKQARETQEQLS